MVVALVLLTLGLLGLYDTLRPQRIAQAVAYGDPIGFGLYVGCLSGLLATAGFVLALRNRADLLQLKGHSHAIMAMTPRRIPTTLAGNPATTSFLLLTGYLLATQYAGYAPATLFFFFIAYRWRGYRHSLGTALLSAGTTMLFLGLARLAEIPIPMLPRW